MKKDKGLKKFLAVVGTVLVWLVLLSPVVFSAIKFIRSGIFTLDYLMPAEFFPVALVGGLLLMWAAGRLAPHRSTIGLSLLAAILCLVISQGLAVVTGLADGSTPPTGWQWVGVVSLLVLYILSVAALGVGGVRLARELFKKQVKPVA